MKGKESEIKQQAWNRARTERLGTDPKEVRKALRAELEPSFYISSEGKKGMRTLHRLGQCYMISGTDYMRFTYAGAVLQYCRAQPTLTRCANCAPNPRDSLRVSKIRRRRTLLRPVKPARDFHVPRPRVLGSRTAQVLSSRPMKSEESVLFWTFQETKRGPLMNERQVHGRCCYELKGARTEDGFPKMHKLWVPRPAQSSGTPKPFLLYSRIFVPAHAVTYSSSYF